MRNIHRTQQNVTANINLTPLIDMVFILLIFFLVTSSFTKEAGIEVSRPTAQSAERQEHASIIIAVSKDGKIWLDNQNIDIRSVRPQIESLHAQNPEGTIIIMSDKDARMGIAIQVLDQVRLAGVSNVALATTAKP
ncbi:MAG: ExbD/TolR family protein [Gammaproteobacteria bacterium]